MNLVFQPEYRRLDLAIQVFDWLKSGPARTKHARCINLNFGFKKCHLPRKYKSIFWIFFNKNWQHAFEPALQNALCTQFYVFPLNGLFNDKLKRLTHIYFYRLSCSMHTACCILHTCWRMNRMHADQYFTRNGFFNILLVNSGIHFGSI